MSNKSIVGVLDQISAKPWQDRKTGQDITLYSFTLEGQRQWYRTGTTQVPFPQGTAVKFVADGQNVDVKSFEKVETGAVQAPAPTKPAAASVSSTARSAAGAASRDEYWAKKEARDLEKDARFQAVNEPRMAMSVAVSAAAAIVDTAVKNEALSFGTTAKSKRLDMLADFVELLADRLYLKIVNAPLNAPDKVPQSAQALASGVDSDE